MTRWKGLLSGLERLLISHAGPDAVLTVADPDGPPDGGLPVGFDLRGNRSAVALVVPVDPGTDLYAAVRAIADQGDGRLVIPLTPTGARHTAGRLAVRADEVDVDHAGPLRELADAQQRTTLRWLVYTMMPAEVDDDVAGRAADAMVDQMLALGWSPPTPGNHRRSGESPS